MANHLTELLKNAVEKHIGPSTGVLLSGGIDSSTVAHFAPDLPRFTGFYQGEPYDERPWARLVAGPNHVEIEITPQDFIDYFDDMLNVIEPPYAGPGTFGQYMVSKRVSEYPIKTVLSGEGGDELFGGYARLHLVAGVPPPEGYEDYELSPDYPRDLHAALDWEWEVNLPALLRVDAQVTSAWRLRAIAPMTDISVTSYVLAQADRDRIGKKLLKEAMQGLLPDEILNRKDKRGFPVPFVEWAQEGPLRDFIGDRIGYIPDPEKPWDRQWWLDICQGKTALV